MKKYPTGLKINPQDYKKLKRCIYCGKAENQVCSECSKLKIKFCVDCGIILRDKERYAYYYDSQVREDVNFKLSKRSVKEFIYRIELYYPSYSDTQCLECHEFEENMTNHCEFRNCNKIIVKELDYFKFKDHLFRYGKICRDCLIENNFINPMEIDYIL